MTDILIGCKNFDFFSKNLLKTLNLVVVASQTQEIPNWLTEISRVVRVEERYDQRSKTMQLDASHVIRELRALGDIDGYAHAFCNQEANLEVAEQIRREFGIFDHLGGNTDRFREKPLMKDKVLSAGLRAPRYCVLPLKPSLSIYDELVATIGSSFIVKPCASVGSRGVYKIFSQADLKYFILNSEGDGCTYEAEEFINGTLFQFDFAMQNGKLLARAVSRYSCPMVDLQEGRTLASIMMPAGSTLFQKIESFGLSCARALDITDGCFHMELFSSIDGELVFLEIAARSPGLLTVPAYCSWLGINFYDIELFIQLEKDATNLSLCDAAFVAKPAFFAVFPKKSGTVKELASPSLNGEYTLDWRIKPGEVVAATDTNIDYAGLLFLVAANEEDAIADLEYLTTEFVPVLYSA